MSRMSVLVARPKRTLAALATVLVAVEEWCTAGPLALCAEDLHHADGDSLRVLGQLVDATHDLPLTLILAVRPLPVRDQLTAISARLGPDDRLHDGRR